MRWPLRVLADFIAGVVADVVTPRVTAAVEQQLAWHLINFTRETRAMNASLQKVMDEVEATKTVTQSAIALMQGLASQLAEVKAELAESGVTSAKLDALASDLDANVKSLAGAIVANTPSDGTEAPPPAPEGGTEAPPADGTAPSDGTEGGGAPPTAPEGGTAEPPADVAAPSDGEGAPPTG